MVHVHIQTIPSTPGAKLSEWEESYSHLHQYQPIMCVYKLIYADESRQCLPPSVLEGSENFYTLCYICRMKVTSVQRFKKMMAEEN